MEPISSASPAALTRYGRVGVAIGDRAAAEASRLDAVLATFHARCREYTVHGIHGLVERLASYGRHERELATWTAKIADDFRRADTGTSPSMIGSPLPRRPRISDVSEATRWNSQARQLTRKIRLLRQLIRMNEKGSARGLLVLFLPSILSSAQGIAQLSGQSSTPRDGDTEDLTRIEGLLLVLHSFWRKSMANLEPQVYRELSAEIDALNLVIARDGSIPWSRPYTGVQTGMIRDRRTGALHTSVHQAFPWSTLPGLDPETPFHPHPADSFAGEHSGISYRSNEQVLLERLSDGGYRISIAGLDPAKPGAPNNLEAVALTAQGVREGNHYYAVVKARVLNALRQIPPGSTLHLQGHSMGGGMCFLLRGDPEVRKALAAAGIVVGSLITWGAVRPKGATDKNPDDDEVGPFARLEERHYVNLDDSLALNVGAGHDGYPHVISLADNKIDEPSAAHNGYGNPENYADLPPELLELPYLIDDEWYEVYNPELTMDWADMPELAPSPTPRDPGETLETT